MSDSDSSDEEMRIAIQRDAMHRSPHFIPPDKLLECLREPWLQVGSCHSRLMAGRGPFAREVADLLTRCLQQHPAKSDARSRDTMQTECNADPVAHGDMPMKVLLAFAGGCGPGIIFTLEFAGLLKSKVVVKAVLQLCRRVACMHTQKEFLDTCERGKGCPSCLWVHLAVCLEQHPDLSPEVADVLEQLIHDRRREIVKLIMAPMRLIRRAWSRTHDSANPKFDYPYGGNCLDFRPRQSSSVGDYTGGSLDLYPSAEAECSLLGVDSSKMFFGPDSNSLSSKLSTIMLSEALKKLLMSLEDEDECGYREIVDHVLAYLSDERDWMEDGLVAGSLPPVES
jgi:hypothetical protein